jgi:hypothetical protein
MRRLCCLLAVPVVAAACGGSGDDAKSARPRLTHQQFVKAANDVCLRSDRRIFRLGRLSIAPAGWAATARAARTGIAEMTVLSPPAALDARFRRLVRLGRRLVDDLDRTHDALVRKDYAAARTAQLDATTAGAAVHRQAKRLGLTFCQQPLAKWPA